jgi:hypothetical protein
MSGVQEFVCYDCSQFWRDKYSFWNGYQSACPLCGKSCEAVCDTQAFADQKEMRGLYDRPLHDYREGYGRTEADLEAERDLIHDEIVEALGAAESTSEADEDSDSDQDADGDDGGGF